MRHIDCVATGILVICAGLGIYGIFYAWPGEFPPCAVGHLDDPQKLAVAELTDIAKWGLGLSVGLVGLFGSILMGIKEGLKFTHGGRLLLLSAILCFSFSAYFALVWRKLLVQAFYANCITLITTPWMSRAFDVYTYFFVGGLAIVASMLALLVFSQK
ncbi:hypothetical protein [Paraburkholderia sp. GAS42]|uniref:hypothetical protein n=1 Tax=Paraburkholderia sp. GAS42 TaxID=3035135 RepID=UPI003D23362E